MNASILSAETESLLPFSVTKKCKRTTFGKKKKKKHTYTNELNSMKFKKVNAIPLKKAAAERE